MSFFFNLDGRGVYDYVDLQRDISETSTFSFHFSESAGILILMDGFTHESFRVDFCDEGMKWANPADPDLAVLLVRLPAP